MTPITDKAVQKLKNTYEAKEKLSNIIIPTSHVLVYHSMSRVSLRLRLMTWL